MANEVTVNATLAYDDDVITALTSQVTDLKASVTTKLATIISQLIGTSETAITLGGIGNPRWVLMINRDSVNYVEIKVATSGAIFAKLLPGEFCLLPLGSGAQVPYAIAHTSTIILDVMMCSA